MSKQNRMPGLRRKGDIWHIEKRCKYCPGGWLRESTGTSSRAEAEKFLIRRLAELEHAATRVDEGMHLFQEAGMKYLEEVAHKSSADAIALHLDQLLPFIGGLSLDAIHDGTLKSFIQHEKNRGLSPKSINNALVVVSAVLNKAARVWRDEQHRPWLRQAPPRLSRLPTKGHQKKPYPLSWDEQDALFGKLHDDLHAACLFAVNTGCREQEICNLKWSWEVEYPTLNTSVFVLPETLTKNGEERVVILNTIAKGVVDAQRGKDETYVFPHKGKKRRNLRTSAWCRSWDAAGLPSDDSVMKGVHNLRHTFAHRLRAAGVTTETRKVLMGHSNGDITTHYSAATYKELLAAVEKITDRSEPTPILTNVGKVSEMKKG